ncbi:MAG TPA: hypothetical protein VF622_10110 [Segetibacter sp.]|jgi:hypothetical protein
MVKLLLLRVRQGCDEEVYVRSLEIKIYSPVQVCDATMLIAGQMPETK